MGCFKIRRIIMVQTKIIRESPEVIEATINNFLKQIGTIPNTRTSIIDIKLHVSDLQHGKDVAMIIYNQVRLQPQQPQPALGNSAAPIPTSPLHPGLKIN